MSRSINAAGLALIKSFEGFSARPYQDSAGVWTIGYGHTQGVTADSLPITEMQAEEMLRADLEESEETVQRRVQVPLNDNQYAALVALVYNAGPAPLERTLGALLNAGDYAAAANEFLRWDYVGSVVSEGLARRRETEKELFLRDNSRGYVEEQGN